MNQVIQIKTWFCAFLICPIQNESQQPTCEHGPMEAVDLVTKRQLNARACND